MKIRTNIISLDISLQYEFFAHRHSTISQSACMLETQGPNVVPPGTSPRFLIVTSLFFGNLIVIQFTSATWDF